jgi:predicted porin
VAVKLKGVTQLQLEARYALNDQWNMYLQSQLLAGDNAQLWYTYPTYTNLLLVGMRYKFDILF